MDNTCYKYQQNRFDRVFMKKSLKTDFYYIKNFYQGEITKVFNCTVEPRPTLTITGSTSDGFTYHKYQSKILNDYFLVEKIKWDQMKANERTEYMRHHYTNELQFSICFVNCEDVNSLEFRMYFEKDYSPDDRSTFISFLVDKDIFWQNEFNQIDMYNVALKYYDITINGFELISSVQLDIEDFMLMKELKMNYEEYRKEILLLENN